MAHQHIEFKIVLARIEIPAKKEEGKQINKSSSNFHCTLDGFCFASR
jgi:hypothetical protein